MRRAIALPIERCRRRSAAPIAAMRRSSVAFTGIGRSYERERFDSSDAPKTFGPTAAILNRYFEDRANEEDDMDKDRLDGQTALVTGATRGIGRATANALAGAGATVIVHGRDPERGAEVVAEIEAAGAGARFLAAELAD